jgi:hypothetical protein
MQQRRRRKHRNSDRTPSHPQGPAQSRIHAAHRRRFVHDKPYWQTGQHPRRIIRRLAISRQQVGAWQQASRFVQ